MNDSHKTKQQLIDELQTLRAQIQSTPDANIQPPNQQRHNALLQINRTIQDMVQATDLVKVIGTLHDQLQHARIPFSSLSIHHIINEDTCQVKSYRIIKTGAFRANISVNKSTVADWKSGTTIYRPNIENDLQGLPKDYLNYAYQTQGLHVRSMLNAPFNCGVLVLRSEQAAAFPPEDIHFIEQISQTLSLGISRAEDLSQKETQIEEIENIYRSIPIGLFVIDRDLRLIRFNARLAEINGLQDKDIGRTLYDIIPDQIQEREQQFKHIFESGKPALGIKVQGHTPNEPHVPKTWLASYSPLKSAIGEVDRILGAVVDITELEKTEQALQESEIQHRKVLENALDGVVSVNDQGEIIRWNRQAEIIFGWSFEDIEGNILTQTIIPPNNHTAHLEGFKRFLATGEASLSHQRIETLALHKDGHTFPVELSIVPIKLEDGYTFTAFVRDLSERKQMEAERERSQRLRALGEMAAGISHNLNNILTGILGPAQMLQLTHPDPQVLEEVDVIITAGLRARDIVSRLNKGWRTDTETLEATDINQAISEAIQAARPRWKDAPESRGLSIEVHPHLADVPHIQGTQSGLYDIIINLIFNAADAMPKGGLISLTTIQTKDHVRLLVSDTGTGMSAETLERIFNPFFTTKGEVGTGLGLSTVYGTINRWGGKIDVASTLGQGTTFTLDFAIWEGDEIERTEQAPQKATGRTCRILIVEDDEIVTRVLDRTLSSHQIDTVSSSQEALEIFAPNTYDVLITDLGLPHLPGDQLAQQLRQKDPNLITILISGWELLPNDPRRAHFFAFVQKPFHDLDSFRQIITKALESKDQTKTP